MKNKLQLARSSSVPGTPNAHLVFHVRQVDRPDEGDTIDVSDSQFSGDKEEVDGLSRRP